MYKIQVCLFWESFQQPQSFQAISLPLVTRILSTGNGSNEGQLPGVFAPGKTHMSCEEPHGPMREF